MPPRRRRKRPRSAASKSGRPSSKKSKPSDSHPDENEDEVIITEVSDGLGKFVVESSSVGSSLGLGAFGTVYEVEVGGNFYSGKIIKDNLLRPSVESRIKYCRECHFLSELNHSNIPEFFGVCYLRDLSTLPVLLIEKLETNLHNFLKNTREISFAAKRSILEDIAKGLKYLHEQNPPIIHRDLTARNILLTRNWEAKISDISNCQLVEPTPSELIRILQDFPDTMVYMPPEIHGQLVSTSEKKTTTNFSPSMDIFSFGHLALFVALKVFPNEISHHKCSEIERRKRYFNELESKISGGEIHPLVVTIKKCLRNEPLKRPTTKDLLSEIMRMKNIDEGLLVKVQDWNKKANRPVVLVTAGKRGAGKSTLVNNLLDLKNKEKVKTKISALGSVTKTIVEREAKINGITVKIIDTPGLGAMDRSEKEEKITLSMLSESTGGEADLLLYCVNLVAGSLDKIDREIITMMNNTFTEKIWEKTIVVLTHADSIVTGSDGSDGSDSDDEQERKDLHEAIRSYSKGFQKILNEVQGASTVKKVVSGWPTPPPQPRPDVIVAMPSGKRSKPNKPPIGWKSALFQEALKKCDSDAIPAILQMKGVEWKWFKHQLVGYGGAVIAGVGGVFTGGFGGGAAGGSVGLATGAALGGAVGLATGSLPGAIAGAHAGAEVGASVGAMIGGYMIGAPLTGYDWAKKGYQKMTEETEYARIVEARARLKEKT